MHSFLKQYGYESDRLVPVSSDWGLRRYFRVYKGAQSSILMVCEDSLTRSSIPKFLEIAQWLRDNGMSAPEIFQIDLEKGFVLLEDFGTQTCEDYDLLASSLSHLQTCAPPDTLPHFLETSLYQAHRRVIDYYVPSVLGQKNPDGMLEEYLSVWRAIEKKSPRPQTGFVHIDFHPGNFMMLKNRKDILRCGFLDFQDACIGPIAYDYTNLLRDIRRDVSKETQACILRACTQNMTAEDKESFEFWYRFLSVQFHLRIVGQVIKLSLHNGRDDLLQFLPRVTRYLKDELQDPLFADLNHFFTHIGLDWSLETLKIDSKLISPDAF